MRSRCSIRGCAWCTLLVSSCVRYPDLRTWNSVVSQHASCVKECCVSGLPKASRQSSLGVGRFVFQPNVGSLSSLHERGCPTSLLIESVVVVVVSVSVSPFAPNTTSLGARPSLSCRKASRRGCLLVLELGLALSSSHVAVRLVGTVVGGWVGRVDGPPLGCPTTSSASCLRRRVASSASSFSLLSSFLMQ